MVKQTVPAPRPGSSVSVDTFSSVKNPGVTEMNRTIITGVALVLSAVVMVLIDWPSFNVFTSAIAPIGFVGMLTAGVWLLIPLKKTSLELAILEYAEYGLSDSIINNVILANRQKVLDIEIKILDITDASIKRTLARIARETLDLIDGFKDDPTDVARSRTTLTRCLDQTIKIVENYRIIEGRRETDQTADLTEQTYVGLQQIAEAIEEQHRRNMDNNQTALSVDLEVSDQLLSHMTKS